MTQLRVDGCECREYDFRMNMNMRPHMGVPGMNQPPVQGEFKLNDPDKEKIRLIDQYKISPDAASRMKYVDGAWMYGAEKAEEHFKDLDDLYKDSNDNSEIYKH